MTLVAALVVVAYAGCQDGDTPDDTEKPAVKPKPQVSVRVKQPAKEEPAPPPTIPEVLLPEALDKTCLRKVGDAMPEAELPDPAGNVQSFHRAFGDKLTVVFFWTSGSSEFSALAARQALEDLEKDVYEPYREKGVQVIGVNEGDPADVAKGLLGEAKVTYPNLLDSDAVLFAQVATERLTRLYLLDAEGKILWFDLEFTRTTRDKLTQGIRVALGEIGEAAEGLKQE
jgi:hypothetical protein